VPKQPSRTGRRSKSSPTRLERVSSRLGSFDHAEMKESTPEFVALERGERSRAKRTRAVCQLGPVPDGTVHVLPDDSADALAAECFGSPRNPVGYQLDPGDSDPSSDLPRKGAIL